MHQMNKIGSTETSVEIMTTAASNMEQAKTSKINAFDLMRVALSSTLAITIFIIIEHVVRHIAGPSAILSIILAAILALLVGMKYGHNVQCIELFIYRIDAFA